MMVAYLMGSTGPRRLVGDVDDRCAKSRRGASRVRGNGRDAPLFSRLPPLAVQGVLLQQSEEGLQRAVAPACAECEAGECRSATVRSRHLRRSPVGPGRRARVGPDVSHSCRASCRTPTTNSFLGRSAPPSARASPRRPGVDTRTRDPRRALARYASTSSAWGTCCFRQR